MKTKILIVVIIFLICKLNSLATIHNVQMCSTTNVDCYVGDTLQFYGVGLDYSQVYINGNIILSSGTPSIYIGQYIIIGGETTWCISYSEGGWYGTITIIPTNTINDFSKKSCIKLFPNPTSDLIFIKNIHPAQLNIYDQSGLIIKTIKIKESDKTISLNELKPGMYFIEIVSNNYVEVLKIIKM